ncbi:MAG: hypothetical protein ACI9KM_002304, partial [Rubritalea sp.]
ANDLKMLPLKIVLQEYKNDWLSKVRAKKRLMRK